MKKDRSLIKYRVKDLRDLYENLLKNSGVNRRYMPQKVVVEILSQSSAPRFYVEWPTARKHILEWYDGIIPDNPMIRARQENLVEVYEKIRTENPYMPVEEVYKLTIEHPAKSFFLSKSTIAEIIYKYHSYRKS